VLLHHSPDHLAIFATVDLTKKAPTDKDQAMIDSSLNLQAILGLPTVQPGDDLAALLISALRAQGGLRPGDILCVVSKVVARAEDRFVDLADVRADPTAVKLSRVVAKDPRLVHLILGESQAVSRVAPGVLIVRHELGFISANAGIDASNVGRDGDWVLLLPKDPDASARALRQRLEDAFEAPIGLVISDSHGRPFRKGTQGVAIGLSGLPALLDKRGEADRFGKILEHTELPLADQIAGACDLVAGASAEGIAAVRLRGLSWQADESACAADLHRPAAKDLYA
jgi:coenzyme F420-0:L-glutamate ligase/coenzyme F420-1:gamma-L-glutamate ligase